MPKWTVVLMAVVLLSGCSGGKKQTATTETPQGAAKLWMQAAMENNNAKLQEMSADEFKSGCVHIAAQVREKFEPATTFRWGASGEEGDEYSWSAVAPGGVVFLKVRPVAEKDYRISDAATSW